jgi:hypothetical protein
VKECENKNWIWAVPVTSFLIALCISKHEFKDNDSVFLTALGSALGVTFGYWINLVRKKKK